MIRSRASMELIYGMDEGLIRRAGEIGWPINKMMGTKHDWDCLLVKAMGMALVTVALTWLPGVFGALAQLVVAASTSGFEQDEMLRKFNAQMISMSVGKLASFVVLLLLARWVFGYPAILQKMLKRVDEA